MRDKKTICSFCKARKINGEQKKIFGKMNSSYSAYK